MAPSDGPTGRCYRCAPSETLAQLVPSDLPLELNQLRLTLYDDLDRSDIVWDSGVIDTW